MTIRISIIALLGILLSCAKMTTDEESIALSSLLKRDFDDGGYMVIEPQTYLHYLHPPNINQIVMVFCSNNKSIKEQTIVALFDQLLQKNKKPATLALPSNPDNGYLIDRSGEFPAYFKKNEGGWEKLYKENPKAHGISTVSRPAIDKANGLLLVYMGTQSHWHAGAGWIIICEYKENSLKELGRFMVWVS